MTIASGHCRDRGSPFVLLSQPDGYIQCGTVAVDNEAAAHLLGHGHQRIGIITGPENSPDNKERLQGYRKALLDHGAPADAIVRRSGGDIIV